MERRKVILARWTSVVACGACAAVVWGIFAAPTQRLFAPIAEHLGTLHPGIVALAVLVVVVLGCWRWGRGRWLAFIGCRHFGTYPPVWMAVAIAILAITIFTTLTGGWSSVRDSYSILWGSLASIPIAFWIPAVPCAFLAYGIYMSRCEVREEPAAEENPRDEFEALVAWIRDDREVCNPDEVRFGHEKVAKRIVDRLTDSAHESPTMAVVGPLGSGKSTIRGVVAEYLKEHQSIQMVHISLWPFDSPEAAVAGILRKVIEALGQHVNTLALTGLSEEYVSTIETVGGRWGGIAKLLGRRSQPEAVLQRLHSIATASGTKIVVWIEDMERFSGSDRLASGEEFMTVADRLRPIHAMLYLLDDCDSVSVIVADTSLRSRIDVGKIARFVEIPPRITPVYVWEQISILRSGCLEMDFIDAASNELRKELNVPEDETHLRVWLWNITYNDPRIQEAIGLLLDTPRSLKSTLRITWETWERLRGEIDFDSVLMASVLRECRPAIFELIENNIDLFREGFRDGLGDAQKSNEAHPVLEQLTSVLSKEATVRMQNALRNLIQYVFPAYGSDYHRDDNYATQPQGLHVVRHTDYWRRYLTLPNVTHEDSDQAALDAIAAWANGNGKDLISRLLDPVKSAQIETFVGQFTADQLCELLATVAPLLRNESAADWIDGRKAPGIVPIWRMMHRRKPRAETLANTIIALLTDLLPAHIPLTSEVLYFFAYDERSRVPSLLDEAQRTRVREAVREAFVRTYGPGCGKQVLYAMHDGPGWAVWWVCGFISSRDSENSPFEGWSRVAAAFVDAAVHDPERGLPLIVPFFTSSQFVTNDRPIPGTDVPQPVREWEGGVHETKAQALFDFDRVADLLRATERPPHLDSQLAAQYDAARDAALAMGPSDEDVQQEPTRS